jgi:hypothetical protein
VQSFQSLILSGHTRQEAPYGYFGASLPPAAVRMRSAEAA